MIISVTYLLIFRTHPDVTLPQPHPNPAHGKILDLREELYITTNYLFSKMMYLCEPRLGFSAMILIDDVR